MTKTVVFSRFPPVEHRLQEKDLGSLLVVWLEQRKPLACLSSLALLTMDVWFFLCMFMLHWRFANRLCQCDSRISQETTSNKGIATSKRGITKNKKLLVARGTRLLF